MESTAVESIVRYSPISESLATAGQPSEAQLEALAAAGFEVVINLALHDDPRYSLKDEEATVASLGMQYVHIPVQFAAPTRANLIAFFEAMERADKLRFIASPSKAGVRAPPWEQCARSGNPTQRGRNSLPKRSGKKWSNPSIERTSSSQLRWLPAAAHVER